MQKGFYAMRYTTVLFDADDTLFDFQLAEHEAIKSVLLRFGLPCEDSVIKTYSEINLSLWKLLELGKIQKSELKVRRFEIFCEKMGFDVDAKEMAIAYMDALSKQNYLKEGALELCDRLHGKCRLCIITNGIKSIQTKRFSTSPIAKYFDKIFISEELGYDKPSVEFFRLVEQALADFDKEKTIVVGDSLTSDIKGGIGYGLDTCWFNPHGNKSPDNMNITYTVDSLEKIYDIVNAE